MKKFYSIFLLLLCFFCVENLQAQSKDGEYTIDVGESVSVSISMGYWSTLSRATNVTYNWSSSSSSLSISSTTKTSCSVKGLSPVNNARVNYHCSYFIDGFYRTMDFYYEVNVRSNIVYVTSVSVSPGSISLTEGGGQQLSASVYPTNATNRSVTWYSNDNYVASVSSTGYVTARGVGNARIYAEANDGSGRSDYCYVTVSAKSVSVTSVSVSPGSLTLDIGESRELAVSVSPSDASNKSVRWSSADSSVATVSDNGVVTAVSSGTVRITATAQDGSGCSDYCSVTVVNEDDYYNHALIDGLYYILDRDSRTAAVTYKPESVDDIAEQNADYVSGNINIPENVSYRGEDFAVTSIGNYAFYGCSGLQSVALPHSISEIGEAAFYDCAQLAGIDFPEGLVSVSPWSFSGCLSISELNFPESLTTIGKLAFQSLESLRSLEIPPTVMTLGENAFWLCKGLEEITILPGDAPLTVGAAPFGGIEDGLLVIDRNWTGDPESSIMDKFYGYITCGLNLTEIPPYAFYGIGFQTFYVSPNVEKIGAYAFADNEYLESVTMGNSIKEIGEYAFGGCPNLTEVAITTLQAPAASNNTFYNYNATLNIMEKAVDSYLKESVRCWYRFGYYYPLEEPTAFYSELKEIRGSNGFEIRITGYLNFEPQDLKYRSIWTMSDDPTVATIDSDGVVTIIDDSRTCNIICRNYYNVNNTIVIPVNGSPAESAIDSIEEEGMPAMEAPRDIYTLQGVCLKRDATQADIDALSPGIYIIGGKKIAVK